MSVELSLPIVVAYGGGVNSTAMLVEMSRREITPSLILFADTGGERPETYKNVEIVSQWCESHGFPAITVVKNPGPTLEEDCLTRNALPSIVYGFKSCSDRWKQRPQRNYIKHEWEYGKRSYIKALGFDAGEWVRIRDSDEPLCTNWFTLVEWKIFRSDCVRICEEAGLAVAKSSCFFCPSMKKHEVLTLSRNNPDLLERAVSMEENASLTKIKGLGRHWSWKGLVEAEANQVDAFDDSDTPEIACACYDG